MAALSRLISKRRIPCIRAVRFRSVRRPILKHMTWSSRTPSLVPSLAPSLGRARVVFVARPGSRPALFGAVALGFVLWVASVAAVQASTLADALEGAMALAAQQDRVTALRREGDAVRLQAEGLIAADPALRLKAVSDRLTEDSGAYELEALVELPLWLPGQRGARLALAQSLGVRADALQRWLRWEVVGVVRESLWTLALAEGRLRQARAALEAAHALEATVAKRAQAGEMARMEQLTAAQETQSRAVERDAAQLAYDQAQAAYQRLTGLPEPPQPLREPVPALAEPLQLPTDHPLLASAAGEADQARAERERVAADGRGNPLLSLGAKRVRDDRDLPAVDALQLEISVPFGLKRQRAPALAAAERTLTDRLAELHQVRREAERELQAAAIGYRGALASIDAAERRAALAAEALAVTRRAWDLGEADLAARLRAEERARAANLDLELQRLEQGHSIARLRQALGMIPQ